MSVSRVTTHYPCVSTHANRESALAIVAVATRVEQDNFVFQSTYQMNEFITKYFMSLGALELLKDD